MTFHNIPLQEADLRDANAMGEKNLAIEQLSKVKSLYKTKLDLEIMEQIKKCCPHLLEEPKKETDQKDKTEQSGFNSINSK